MANLYIDFTHSVPFKNAKVHGGGNFTKTIIKMIANRKSENNLDSINILWPIDYEPQDVDEKDIYESSLLTIIKIYNSIEEVLYEKDSVLYLPLLAIKEYTLIKRIKNKNDALKIILTIHGLRLLDLPYDIFDKHYYSGITEIVKYYINDVALLPIRKIGYKLYLKKYIKYVDKVFTVSNFSLSQIYARTKFEKLTYINQDVNVDENSCLISEDGNYMLFVSGNRPEKNLARTLFAYKRYLVMETYPLCFKITGVSDKIAKNLVTSLKLEDIVSSGKIEFLGYVSKDKLTDLYKKASFLVYTSKSEGYGLPVLEAAKYGCPSIAPVGTSVPEVLGTAAKYVSPYSTESISEGMQWMSVKNNRNYIKAQIAPILETIRVRINLSNEHILRLLLEEID